MGKQRAIVALGAAAALATGIIGGTAASGDTAVHVILTGDLKIHVTDPAHNGLTLGDRLAARGPLVDAAKPDKRVGTAFLDCWVAKNVASGNGLFDCTYLLHLGRGDLTLQGLDPPGPGSSDFIVTGGDGAFRGATGDAVFTDSAHSTDMQITLVD